MSEARKAALDRCCQKIAWRDLDLAPIRSLIALAKAEDLEGLGLAHPPKRVGDPSSDLIEPNSRSKSVLRAREPLVVCGLPLGVEVASAYDANLAFKPVARDGDHLQSGDVLAELHGPARAALSAERPLLNFLQRLSGVATMTRRFADKLDGSDTRLLDTRKTTPGYRMLEKYAVATGGGWNHRLGLFDRIMLKDNHLAAFKGDFATATVAAVTRARERFPELLVEMEVDRLDQIPAVLAAGVDIVLLDNFSVADLEQARKIIAEKAVTEISGGVDLGSIEVLKGLGHDFISTGALVHKSVWVDIGLDWD